MTKAAKRAIKSVGVPTIALHASGQYYARIGYNRTADGNRQRRFWYLGRDEPEAVQQAAAIKVQWKALKRAQGSGAVWNDATDETPEMREAVTHFHEEMRIDALERDVDEQVPRLRLEQVRAMYDEYREAKIGVGGEQGLKRSTFTDASRNLRLALGYVDAKSLINSLGHAEIETWKDAIFRRVNGKADGITRRTAVNYCRAIKGMLDWSHRRADVPYRHPEDVADLFSFSKFTTVNVAAYDAKQLKGILKLATDRERLYVYLGLNCGYYPSDIGNIQADEIIATEDGRHAIVRRRDKTSHQNEFEGMHVLWDETYNLLAREMAQRNIYGLALLNEVGKPLYRHDEDGKYNGIGHAHGRLLAKATKQGVAPLSFKQLRKIGTSAMERLGGQQARRLYKAGTIDSGDKVYIREAWENLTPHLSAWGEQLRADGVLYDQPQKQ